MGLRDLLYETWHALAANKGRSFLTILGIVIGISAVITMTSLIGGMQNMLVGELGLSQARQVYIYVSTPEEIGFDDLDQIESSVPGYEFVTGSISGSASVSSNTESAGASAITGVKPEYFQASGQKLYAGEFFTDDDETNGTRVVIIDQNMVKSLFGNYEANVVGQTMKIGDDDYTIVGILESSAMMSMGASVYVPFSTAQTRIIGATSISEIIGFAQEGVDMEKLSADTKTFLAARYSIAAPDEDIYIMAMSEIISQLETMMTAFSVIMGAVASISLFVGGIGIMNMMLTNVTERIREIGLRKSLGARARDVTKQFLLEAIMLCVAGGVFGIIFGFLGAWILGAIIGAIDPTVMITPAFSAESVLLAVGVCVLIGLVFGYYPARRAAKLDPIESLRYQ
ncbi:MAG: FtsX-like permease family protein [Actinobacteria bacterium]|nr:FtsX-like permease family protein [Actinomycetota bacterium]